MTQKKGAAAPSFFRQRLFMLFFIGQDAADTGVRRRTARAADRTRAVADEAIQLQTAAVATNHTKNLLRKSALE